jgi:hypoxanthine phosphoribosyltransferase
MEELKLSTLISAEAIQKRVQEIGLEITRQYKGKDLVAICVLRGAYMFFADLIRNIDTDLKCEFLGLSSYTHTTSSGEVKMTLDLSNSIEGKHVLIVEDIVDTGRTLHFFLDHLRERRPASLSTVAFLRKPEALEFPVTVEHVGFDIEDRFVVGYGLDYNEQYRNLPYLGLLKRRVYENPGKADL